MSDWVVGDLAVCVDNGPLKGRCGRGHKSQRDLPLNTALRVDGVQVGYDDNCSELHLVVSGRLRLASRFRKIAPDQHAGEREDWELLLDSMKRRVRV